jgi:hypothetical protein
MGKIHNLNKTDRPHAYALIMAIHKAIDDIATDNMTLFEILGCLDVVSKDFHLDFINNCENEE